MLVQNHFFFPLHGRCFVVELKIVCVVDHYRALSCSVFLRIRLIISARVSQSVTDRAPSYRSCFIGVPVFTTRFCRFFPKIAMLLVVWSLCRHSNLFLSQSATLQAALRYLLLYSKLFLTLIVPLRAVLLLDSKLYLSLTASLRAILSLYRYSTLFLSLITSVLPSYCFVELFCRLIATLQVVLCGLLRFK